VVLRATLTAELVNPLSLLRHVVFSLPGFVLLARLFFADAEIAFLLVVGWSLFFLDDVALRVRLGFLGLESSLSLVESGMAGYFAYLD